MNDTPRAPSGIEWRRQYGDASWRGKEKPAPSYVDCPTFKVQKAREVCAAELEDECRACTVPTSFVYLIRLGKRRK